ncbi:hypothetical protein GGF50DRAFT_109063 [Schizophyllum commune]
MSSFGESFEARTDLPDFSAEQDTFDAVSILDTRATSSPTHAFMSGTAAPSFHSSWMQLGAPPCGDDVFYADDQHKDSSASYGTLSSTGYGRRPGYMGPPSFASNRSLNDNSSQPTHSFSLGNAMLNAGAPSLTNTSLGQWGLHDSTYDSSFAPVNPSAIFHKNSFASVATPTSQAWNSCNYGSAAFGGLSAPEATIRDGGMPHSGRVFAGGVAREAVGGDTYAYPRRSPAHRMVSPPTCMTAAGVPRISAPSSRVSAAQMAYSFEGRRQVAPIAIPAPPLAPSFASSGSPTSALPSPSRSMHSKSSEIYGGGRDGASPPQLLRRESDTLSSPSSSTSSSPTSATFSSPSLSMSGSAGTAAERKAQRKARRDATQALNVGLAPSNPEALSSHEKKRYYLESLEQYVMYLHEQLKLVGTEPVPLERVSTYRGLSSRSIRTLLVHMRNGVGKLSLRTESEEQKFIERRDAVYSQELEPRALHEYERHFGIATASKMTHMGEPLGSSLGSLGIAAVKGEDWSSSRSADAPNAVHAKDIDEQDNSVLESPGDGSKK